MGVRYGQHYLINARAIAAMLERFEPRRADRVVEIGPGRGALTRLLLARCGALAAIEIDANLARALAAELDVPLVPLRELGPQASLRTSAAAVVEGDALEVSYAELAGFLGAGADDRVRVIGNLPFGVATALLQRMVAQRDRVRDAFVMVQKEVADRILAEPRVKDYGLLSVILSLRAERERVLTLNPGSFSPPPKVRSTVVHIRFHRPSPGFEDEDARLLTLLKAAFTGRRKMLVGNLARSYHLDRKDAAALLDSCGASPAARAEELAPKVFLRLARSMP